MSDRPSPVALPPLLAGNRRRLFAALVLAGLAQAAAAGLMVLALSRALEAGTTTGLVAAVLAIVAVACTAGWTRSREWLLAERLGQDYVHEIRLLLVERVLDGHRSGSLGAVLTRTSNDLTAVRNWVALGVGPLAAGVPLLLGCTVVLALLHPLLALATLLPVTVYAVVLWFAGRQALSSSERLRRERGRLASHLADTFTASVAIRSAGGGYRELRRLDRRSATVVNAAIARARVLGRMKGAATAATGCATAAVVVSSVLAELGTVQLAAALTVVGMLAAPLEGLGRLVQYRQSFRAARTMLVPALAATTGPRPPTSVGEPVVEAVGTKETTGIVVRGLELPERPGVMLPPLYARAGDRVVVRSDDRAWVGAVLETLVSVRRPPVGAVRVAGSDLALTPSRTRRGLVGYATRGMRLERGPLSRALRYRCPDADMGSVRALLDRVGLAERVAALPQQEDAALKNGGEPLTVPERARLVLARAVLGEPPLLVLDHVDDDLDASGTAMLKDLLDSYPGVVVVASRRPEDVVTATRRWDIGDAVYALPPAAELEPAG